MSDSTHLALPYLEAAQAQKHVTVNEALARLDALVQLAVISRGLATPPATPVEGDRYLVPAAATGVWASHIGDVALFLQGAWNYAIPRAGWRLWVADESKLLVFDGTVWLATGEAGTLQNVPLLGVNATADATNKLAVSSAATLFTHAGAGHQIKLNKFAQGNTASLLWQTGLSGRAELGTTGDDNFHVKVSGNGTTWSEALTINRTTGVVSLPQGLSSLPLFSVTERGLVPQAVAGTQKYLRTDGTWEAPPGAGAAIPYKTASSRWQVNSADTTTLTTLVGAANRIDLAPWLCALDMNIDQVGVLCSTAVAGAQGKLVCYDSDAEGRPASLLFETAVLDFATVGFKAVAQVQAFQRGGLYWLGLRHSATATVNAHQPYCTPVLGYPAVPTTAASKLLRRTLAFATAAPANWGWSAAEETAANVPAVFLELA